MARRLLKRPRNYFKFQNSIFSILLRDLQNFNAQKKIDNRNLLIYKLSTTVLQAALFLKKYSFKPNLQPDG